ncbi:Gfo/Idh/MocA family protein [Actinotalea sp. K2]|uniref:Gfo/Idh/MocA family protein n=1 Tax=Actinotalea sp. K2 TaxID=2939438 RepID=UPI002018231B|nr:Gfo/Idh/MocA family oxidoreductase [Actinotalea sp. K2]MCL3859475.1 Gfo/Idh/MocA family oxidoreductase [Actinotalea sp. K2]
MSRTPTLPRRRTLVVGTGGIAGAHAAAVAAHAGRADVVCGVDLDPARAEAFAVQHGLAGWSTDLAAALQGTWTASTTGTDDAPSTPVDPRPDLAHICTPPGSHVPLAVQCLEAGVPVLLEKPPALSLAEVDELLAVSQRTGVDVAVVFQHRFGSGALRARALLEAAGTRGLGEEPGVPTGIGRPLVATCHTLWYRDADYFAVPWRGRWEIEGGGPTMGHGIHQFDLLLALLGPWAEVTAMAGRQARDTATEDVSMAVVRFAGGALATVVNSVVSPRQTSSLRIDTERATLEVEHLYGYGDEDWTFTPAPGHEDLAALWITDPAAPRSSHSSQVGALLDAMDDDAPLPVTLAEARDTLELVAAIYASAFTGQVVRRGDIGPGHPFYPRMDGTGAPWAAPTEEDHA